MSDTSLEAYREIYDSSKDTPSLILESREVVQDFASQMIDLRATKNAGYPPLYAHNILKALLDYAPTPNGQRYVASAILAQGNDIEYLTKLSRGWVSGLLSPIKARGRYSTQPTSSQTPTLETTLIDMPEPAKRDQPSYRKLLRERQGYKCAVSLSTYDRPLPRNIALPQTYTSRRLQAAHIMPFCLSKYDASNTDSTVSSAITWDMLESWAGIGQATLGGEKINNLSNLILMSTEVHEDFGSFTFWFEETDKPHTYNIRLQEREVRPNWADSATFDDESNKGLPLPNPQYLAIHAAFAKVFYATGAGEYIEQVWRDAEDIGVLSADGSSDLAVLLSSLPLHGTEVIGFA